MSWTKRGHYLSKHKRKSSGCIIMFGFKSHQFSSKVNYHFKSLDQQLKRVLIRLALPLDSHSLRGTSTDLCVSVQQRVCVWICLYVYLKTVFVGSLQSLFISACAYSDLFDLMQDKCNFYVHIFIQCWTCTIFIYTYTSAQQDQLVHPQSPQVRMQAVYYNFQVRHAVCLYQRRFVSLKNLEHPLNSSASQNSMSILSVPTRSPVMLWF